LVQGQVRVSASGHYCYDDSSVVFCYDYFPSYETQPPEADYVDLFSRLSFPMTPLEFIELSEPRGIPLPPALVAKVKEVAGISPLPEAINDIQTDTRLSPSLTRRDEQWQYLNNEIKCLGWDPMRIPYGGKKKLCEWCTQNKDTLFLSEEAFDKFWQDMRRRGRLGN